MNNIAPESRPLHVVLGAGQIGSRLAELLLSRGLRVRQVRLGSFGASRDGIEHISGDITDDRFAEQVGRGASVVYDCMNPPYHRWPELLLPLARGSLRAAVTSGARLVALDSLYSYGRPEGLISESSPVAPSSKKGELRARQAELRLDAHRRGEVSLTIGRASDFIGAALPLSLFSERFFTRILSGASGEAFGDPDLPHSYTYADDVARALVVLGEDDRALGKIWHLPTAPARSTREIMTSFGPALGRSVTVKRMPNILVRAVGVFSPIMREMHEMLYQWEVPFVIDDSRFRATFGVEPTSLDEIIAATARWAAHAFAARAA